ncbi:MAG TPA: citrate/2-methylcitrate synthase, partial [Candidatus Limnocylindrales bacterium]|nr:citrate/2-methylcitrate synthase [Candidatus Limnocylindrales bacterium]
MTQVEAQVPPVDGAGAEGGLDVRDRRTGQTYQLPIELDAIHAPALGKIKVQPDDPGLASYDPGFLNTAACKSAITFIDGEKGILEYRGYPIEQLAGKVAFLDVAYLLIHGELPDAAASRAWADAVRRSMSVPQPVVELIWTLPAEAHPMAVLLAAWEALGTFHPEAVKAIDDPEARANLAPAVIGQIAALTGLVFRHRTGRSRELPEPTADYGGSLLGSLFAEDGTYKPDSTLARALDVLLVLHADHEQNCSTSAVRAVGSSHVEPYSALAAGIAALYGPLHGGANEAVVRTLHEIGTTDAVPGLVEDVKAGKRRLMGFGHRVYKSYDPRARIIKETAMQVFEVTGRNPRLDVALAIEKIALEDSYFV